MLSTAYADREVQVGDLKLHYQEWGDQSSPAMVLLHGFGVSGHMFDEFGAVAGNRYHLFGIDQRGHGDSDWSPEGDYSREAFVSDLEGFRRALGLERFILVGHSMGGLNAVVYAARYPERVERLVLVDVGPEAAREGVDNIVRFTRGPDNLEFEQYVEMAHRFNPRRSIENIRERMRHRLRPTGDGKWTWKFDRRFRDPDSGIRVGSTSSADETWSQFRQVTVPTLLVRGSESDVLTQDVAERVVAEMPAARLAIIPGAGHSVPGDNPPDFTRVVLDFLSETDRDDAAEETPAAEESPGGSPASEIAAATADWWEEGPAAEPRSSSDASRMPAPEATRALPSPGRTRRRRRRQRGPGLLVVAGGLALAAVAAIVGVRSLSRRKPAASRDTQRKKTRKSRGQVDADARDRALSVFDELSALGRDRLERAQEIELRASEPGRGKAKAGRRRGTRTAREKSRSGAARVAGRGVRAAVRLAFGGTGKSSSRAGTA